MIKKSVVCEISNEVFEVSDLELSLRERLKVAPLPYTYYIRRMKENFAWLFYDGELRTTKCAKSDKEIQTNWPAEYNGRILCEAEYLKALN